MRKFLIATAMIMASGSAFAAVNPASFAGESGGNIPASAGSVSNIIMTSATQVISVTVPYGANQAIFGGDDAWVCENPRRCSTTFPTVSTTTAGWLFNPSGRLLLGNCTVSTSAVYLYPRTLPASGSAITSIEWSNNGGCQQ